MLIKKKKERKEKGKRGTSKNNAAFEAAGTKERFYKKPLDCVHNYRCVIGFPTSHRHILFRSTPFTEGLQRIFPPFGLISISILLILNNTIYIIKLNKYFFYFSFYSNL